MPLPQPNKSEKESGKSGQNKFISRCLESSIIQKDFKTQAQRIAVCYSTYEKAKKSKADMEPDWDDFENDIGIFLP